MDQYAAYDLREDDPYLIENSSCLKNLLGFTDTESLSSAEEQLTQITLAELVSDPPQATFNLKHLQAIHFRIFEDVYPFCGQIRKTEIMKGGKLFLPYNLIIKTADELFSQLHEEKLIQGLSPAAFGLRAGYYLGRINMIHPFREGNGRAQRVLIDQLANLNNFAIEWASISGDAMAVACREARISDPDGVKLQRLISLSTVSA
ncbi:MAG: Fic family protein [Pseudomonadales bacterium]|nr:Fic family protein [Pseudomonadales bacterium]